VGGGGGKEESAFKTIMPAGESDTSGWLHGTEETEGKAISILTGKKERESRGVSEAFAIFKGKAEEGGVFGQDLCLGKRYKEKKKLFDKRKSKGTVYHPGGQTGENVEVERERDCVSLAGTVRSRRCGFRRPRDAQKKAGSRGGSPSLVPGTRAAEERKKDYT